MSAILVFFLAASLPAGNGKDEKNPSSMKEIIQQLKSEDSDERNEARRFLLKNVTPSDLSVLFKHAKKTKNKHVGDTLIDAIRRLKTRKAGKVLFRLAVKHDEQYLRISALLAIYQLRDPRARKLILKRLRSDSVSTDEKNELLKRVRVHARYQLREKLRSLIQKELSGKTALEKHVLRILLRNEGSASMAVFKSYFESDRETLKQIAGYGMYKLGSNESVEYLKKKLEAGDLKKKWASEIVRLVERREEERFRETFLKMLEKKPEKLSVHPSLLLQVLGKIGTSDDIAKLSKLEETVSDEGLKRQIQKAILNIASRTDVKTLKELLGSADAPRRRLMAAVLLFRMDKQRGEDALMNFLKRDDTRIQKMALDAFAHRGVLIYQSIPVLIRALNHQKKGYRELALRALKQQIFTFFPYHPFDFSKISYSPDTDASGRKKSIKILERWWEKYGGLARAKGGKQK